MSIWLIFLSVQGNWMMHMPLLKRFPSKLIFGCGEPCSVPVGFKDGSREDCTVKFIGSITRIWLSLNGGVWGALLSACRIQRWSQGGLYNKIYMFHHQNMAELKWCNLQMKRIKEAVATTWVVKQCYQRLWSNTLWTMIRCSILKSLQNKANH